MASLADLIPTKILFVFVFGVLPIILTIHEKGYKNTTTKEWASYFLILLGLGLIYATATMLDFVGMRRYLWPLLVIVALGFLLYRQVMVEAGEWDESSIQRGGASYDED